MKDNISLVNKISEVIEYFIADPTYLLQEGNLPPLPDPLRHIT